MCQYGGNYDNYYDNYYDYEFRKKEYNIDIIFILIIFAIILFFSNKDKEEKVKSSDIIKKPLQVDIDQIKENVFNFNKIRENLDKENEKYKKKDNNKKKEIIQNIQRDVNKLKDMLDRMEKKEIKEINNDLTESIKKTIDKYEKYS